MMFADTGHGHDANTRQVLAESLADHGLRTDVPYVHLDVRLGVWEEPVPHHAPCGRVPQALQIAHATKIIVGCEPSLLSLAVSRSLALHIRGIRLRQHLDRFTQPLAELPGTVVVDDPPCI